MIGLPTAPDTKRFLEVSGHLLGSGHTIRFRARGWSMYPLIQDGDLLLVAPIARDEIRRGDILLCRMGHVIVAHRVARIRRTAATVALRLRGDASFACDSWVGRTEVLGRVIASERNGCRRRLDRRTRGTLGSLAALAWRVKRWVAEARRPLHDAAHTRIPGRGRAGSAIIPVFPAIRRFHNGAAGLRSARARS